MERVRLEDMPIEFKLQLLKQLGYSSDGKYVTDATGQRHKDKYVDVDVLLSRMLILPGSTLILDNNPLSIASYLEEYNNDL